MRPKIIEYFSRNNIPIYVPDFKILILSAIVIGMILSLFFAKKRGLPIYKFYLATALTVIIAFLGGKVYFVIQHYGLNLRDFIFEVILGYGTVSYGVYLGGIIGAFVVLRIMGINILMALDIYAPAIALSLCFGRLGCFLSGCCFGKPCELPWAVSFPPNSPAYSAQVQANIISNDAPYSLPVHPTQIYEALFGVLMFILLLAWYKKNKRDGLLFFVYVGSYAVFRFLIEFLRADERGLLFGLSVPQVFSILFFIFGLLGVTYVMRETMLKVKSSLLQFSIVPKRVIGKH
jgi:phosphatidylglycerol:prolipoprotein diacylglycerol transferase